MAKVLLVLLVVLVVGWLLVGRNRRVRGRDDKASRKQGGAEEMVQCAHCGVHLPRGDAVADGALSYCGQAHRLAGPRAR